jgi:endonuclease/exonuclease/phosphatase family metal-dependent hydrolase
LALVIASSALARDLDLHVVTWNLHGLPCPIASGAPERMSKAADAVLALDPPPDLVAFQEVWRPGYADILVSRFGARYVHVDVPRGGVFGRKGGLLVFVRSDRWRPVANRFEQFERAACAAKFWEGDGLGKKGFQEIALVGPIAMTLVNTHLQSQYGSTKYTTVRQSQLAQVRRTVDALEPGMPVLITGDFNTTTEEPLLPSYFAGLVDLTADWRCANPGHATNDTDGWIDYVFLRGGSCTLASSKLAVLPEFDRPNDVSDHRGLDISLTLHCR